MDISESVQQWPDEPLVAVFFIGLEHPMSIPHRTTLETARKESAPHFNRPNGRNFVGFRFHRESREIDHPLHEGLAFAVADRIIPADPHDDSEQPGSQRNPFPHPVVQHTVVEAATPLLPKPGLSMDEAISNAFDLCVHELRRLMIAYLTMVHDPRLRPISRQTVQMSVPFALMNLRDEMSGMYVFMANDGLRHIAAPPDDFSPEQLDELTYVFFRQSRSDPIRIYAERNRAARRAYLIDGEYTSAVIHCYTACEALLNGVVLLCAWEEGMNRGDTRPWFDKSTSFFGRITSQLPPRLGGNWGTQKPETPMWWLQGLASVRHSVVHLGYTPSELEVQLSLEAVNSVETFIKSRLVLKKERFPRTASIVLGTQGLLRRGVSQRWLDQFMDTVGKDEPYWLSTFSDWLESDSPDS